MEFILKGYSQTPYTISQPERIRTPRLVVFKDRVERNIVKMRDLLQRINPSYGMAMLCPHAKTHKSQWVTRQLMEAGVTYFKATPNEVELLAGAGAKKIFVAYPLLATEVEELLYQVKGKQVQLVAQVGHAKHVEALVAAAKKFNHKWSYYIDVDIGMHRTGVAPEDALSLYEQCVQHTEMHHFSGLHGYDGHNSFPDLSERRTEAARSMRTLLHVMERFGISDIKIPEIMVGGTPSFTFDLEFLSAHKLASQVLVSPGTWIYSDTHSCSLLPDGFDIAACILAQVIDRPTEKSATLNLGHKRWAMDHGAVEAYSVEKMNTVKSSEEHTLVSVPKGKKIDIGDYILIAPRHACSTVNLWEYHVLIDEQGRIADPYCPIEGRNR